ncbi:hypothetical protein Asp14428_05340 [Actinoplanes sp. NBRC 14428]|nr:hypothetical protein Asp14428_05340 [Actinoplanes sp. NBRC 14428]
MTAVLPLLNASLLIGVAVDLVQIVHDPRWTVALGGIVTTAVGIAVLARLWEVFPFAFTDPSTDWAMVVRVVLAVGLIGSAAGLLAHTISLLGAVRQRPRAGHA